MLGRPGLRTIDLVLRGGGVLLGAVAWLAIRILCHLRLPPSPPFAPGPTAVACAAIGLICGCTGAGLIALGHHVFDEVEVSERWRQSDGFVDE